MKIYTDRSEFLHDCSVYISIRTQTVVGSQIDDEVRALYNQAYEDFRENNLLIAFSECGDFHTSLPGGKLPADCVRDCSSSGDVYESVAYWTKKLKFADALAPVRHKAQLYLLNFGAWTMPDLEEASMEELAEKVLRIACCETREEGSWLGVVQ